MVWPCADCGKGPLEIDEGFLPDTSLDPMHVPTHCKSCKGAHVLQARCASAIEGSDPMIINPTAGPSRIIDLAQWLSLFYLLIESAAAEASRPAVRQMGYQAALCLGEALKFYGDNELPPESAFFTESSRQAFHEHPANFARQKLRDIQSKLPAPSKMARRVERDKNPARPRQWWRFWRR